MNLSVDWIDSCVDPYTLITEMYQSIKIRLSNMLSR